MFALLMTQAMVKNGFVIYSDSLLRPAIDHYSSGGDSPELMKTLFYQGEIEMNRFDSLINQPGLLSDNSPYGYLAKSVVFTTQAHELSKHYEDNLWRAKSAELLADAYTRSMHDRNSLEYTEEAVVYYKKSGKIRNHRYSLCDLALDKFAVGDTLGSISILDSISKVALANPVDSGLFRYCCRGLYSISIRSNLLGKASGIRRSLDEFGLTVSQAILGYDAELCLKQGDAEKALKIAGEAYHTAVSPHDRQIVYRIYAIASSMAGEHEKASHYMDTIIMLQYNDFINAIDVSASSAQRDYFNATAAKRQEEIDSARKTMAATLIVLIAVFAAVTLYLRRYAKRKNENIDKAMANLLIKSDQLKNMDKMVQHLSMENEELKKGRSDADKALLDNAERLKETTMKLEETHLKLEETTKQLGSLNLQLRNIDEEKEGLRMTLSSVWTSVNAMCRQYFLNGERNKDSCEIVERIERKMKDLRSAKSLAEMENMANQLHGGIVTRLRERCPHLGQDDIKLAILVYAGFDAAAICMIMGIQHTKTFHNRKFRLREKILASGVTREDPLVAVLF